MTYSLDTLNSRNTATAPEPSGLSRFAQEGGLILGLLALVFWLTALISYSAQDAAWSTSGIAQSAGAPPTRNWGGPLGAYLADASYFLLGFSAWWLIAVGARAWLSGLARWLRGDVRVTAPWSRTIFWLALAALLIASAGLEWSRLYRFEGRLPDHSGGALGFMVGSFSVKWLEIGRASCRERVLMPV